MSRRIRSLEFNKNPTGWAHREHRSRKGRRENWKWRKQMNLDWKRKKTGLKILL